MVIYGDFRTSLKRALDEIDDKWESYKGLIVCGSHSPNVGEIDKILGDIHRARMNGTPYLGICYGHQLAAIEYARNVLSISDATSQEFGKGTYVVKKLPNLNIGQVNGETYWNNYEVSIPFDVPSHFITTQSHPEYQSSIDKPHPLLVKFIKLCKK